MKADWVKFENKLEIPMMETHIRYIMLSLHAEVMEKVAAQYLGHKASETEMNDFKIRQRDERRFVLCLDRCLGEIEFTTTEENGQWKMGYKFTPFI